MTGLEITLAVLLVVAIVAFLVLVVRNKDLRIEAAKWKTWYDMSQAAGDSWQERATEFHLDTDLRFTVNDLSSLSEEAEELRFSLNCFKEEIADIAKRYKKRVKKDD